MKKRYRSKKESMVYVERRCPKGWKAFATNDPFVGRPSQLSDEECAKIDHMWMLAIKQAERDGKKLKEEMKKFRQKNVDDDKSNAEVLVEKKYKRDKTKPSLN